MLKLVNIKKNYKVADTVVRALKGVSICFRKNEFVSILGPSGCGKTTMLNIIGGLDHCSGGDLTIYGKSTAEYSHRDWDVYRNHRIGFVFQSYNLIPHQTVLGNVELALTIAGLSKQEREAKAKAALDKVGLSDQYNKRPNQLSGGQCQRVAIARALVNDPEILLADEPTGALDTVTSKQIMDLVKEIAKERLVIMVTHNPELAEEYSTRIIKLLDGNLVDDSNPFSEAEERAETNFLISQESLNNNENTVKTKNAAGGRAKNKEKAKMSLLTAFKLSLQNLFSKKKRTALTSIASSIGIIGISLVLSFSYGVKSYIKDMQTDMLSGNPITITESAFNLSRMLSGTSDGEKISVVTQHGFINVNAMIKEIAARAEEMKDMMIENNISQEYVDYVLAMPETSRAAIALDYGIDITNNIYTDFFELASDQTDKNATNISLTGLRSIYTQILKDNPKTEDYAGLVMGLSDIFRQVPDSKDYISSQYTLLDGEYAQEADEVMIVLDSDNMLSDLLLAQLGYYNQEEFIDMVYRATEEGYTSDIPEKNRFSLEELKGKSFTWYPNDTVMYKNTTEDPVQLQTYPFFYNAYSNDFTDGTALDKEAKGGIDLRVVGILQPNEDRNYGSLSTGFYYTSALTDYVIAQNINSELINYMLENGINGFRSVAGQGTRGTGITFDFDYLTLEGTQNRDKNDRINITREALGREDSMTTMFGLMGNNPIEVKYISLRELCGGKLVTDEDGANTAVKLPGRISIFSSDLVEKDLALSYLDAWNQSGDIKVGGITYTPEMREEMVYTDTLSVIFGMIASVIDLVTIALIGFTVLALIVSCVMIAIVTYISVVERTKEIGVIRSLGGRKRDVSNLFTAETVIIGLAAGLIAVGFTYLVSGLINLLTQKLASLTLAIFPLHYALFMLLLSVGLTMISGLFPSRSAAKKDPVVALRTE